MHDELEGTVTIEGDQAIIAFGVRFRHRLDNTAFLSWCVLITLRWASWLIDTPLILQAARFPFAPPPGVEELSRFFPCEHSFGSPDFLIALDRRYLDLPVGRTPYEAKAFAKMLPYMRAHPVRPTSLSGRIAQLLRSEGTVDALPLKVVADTLNRSEDTIRRHLKAEGVSWSAIKQNARRDLAMHHLSRLETPIHEIAELVGYSQPSAFNRAFKQWTGRTPGDYRDALAAKLRST